MGQSSLIRDGMSLQSEYSETMSALGYETNRSLPNSNQRPDAYRINEDNFVTEVRELKPDTPTGRRAGAAQLQKYETIANQNNARVSEATGQPAPTVSSYADFYTGENGNFIFKPGKQNQKFVESGGHMEPFTFSDFRSGIVESSASWHRVGKKMMWVYQPDEVIFLLKLIQPKAMKYFDIQLFYGHRDWIQDGNYEAISCGAQAPYRALTRKRDLKLSVTYPGIEENFHGALFDSLLNSDIITRNSREKFPDMMNLELRKKDWTQFFEVLRQRLQPLHTLNDIENEFDGNLNSEFWDRMKQRVTNFPDCDPC